MAPPDGLSAETRAAYERGRLIFNGHFRPSGTEGPDDLVGLGPLYNRISCASCHSAGGRGAPPNGPDENFLTALVRVGVVDSAGVATPHPIFGNQIQDRAVPGIDPEAKVSLYWETVTGTYPDGQSYELRKPFLEIDPDPGPSARWSIRIAQSIRGVGLLEAAVTPKDGDGRFGWKAVEPSVVMQNASALSQDMGITSVFHEAPICPNGETVCGGGGREIPGTALADLTLFAKLLPPLAGEDAPNAMGAFLFYRTGCAACHIPELPSYYSAGTVKSYSDLALHDMGPGLDDGLPEGDAKSFEWRTPPLWGLGMVLKYNPAAPLLHDGRARGAEEAILWHDGEARYSKHAFMELPKEDRVRLLAFLMGL
ncbi:MAG: di-heme oxidoredictase family protein [Alphaproteobacteria bacterium]|nr:di-heme oxidoredictase family protein [Alphaproteobacteria bacterium]